MFLVIFENRIKWRYKFVLVLVTSVESVTPSYRGPNFPNRVRLRGPTTHPYRGTSVPEPRCRNDDTVHLGRRLSCVSWARYQDETPRPGTLRTELNTWRNPRNQGPLERFRTKTQTPTTECVPCEWTSFVNDLRSSSVTRVPSESKSVGEGILVEDTVDLRRPRFPSPLSPNRLDDGPRDLNPLSRHSRRGSLFCLLSGTPLPSSTRVRTDRPGALLSSLWFRPTIRVTGNTLSSLQSLVLNTTV